MLSRSLIGLSLLSLLTACGAPFEVDQPLTEKQIVELDQSIQKQEENAAINRLGIGIGQDEDALKSFMGSNRMCRFSVAVPDKASRGTISLTFDDGPNRKVTPLVLDVLKKYRIKAVFFVLGSKVVGNEDLLQRMVDEGHIVANHSWNHPNFWETSGRGMQAQIDQTHEKLKPFLKGTQFFRYPYGQSTCEANFYLDDLGYRRVGWHIDTCDWAYADGELSSREMVSCGARADERTDYFKYVMRQVRKTQGGVMLMHDITDHTFETLEPVIQMLLKENYKFVQIDDPNYFPHLNQ